MLLSEKVKIKTGSKNFNYFKNLGYKINSSKEIIEIDIIHLTNNSHTIVEVGCDYCGKILNIPYKRFIKHTSICNKYSCSSKECSNKKIKDVCLIKYGVENPFQSEFVKIKIKKTFNDKYGVEHPMNLQQTKDKIKTTCLKKYGFEHDNKSEIQKEKRKITRIKRGLQLPDDLIKPYILYRRKVDNVSDKLKKELLKNWNGYDYYDNEYIKDNFTLNSTDKNFPTIDHKISVIYGFINNIPFENISNINNLCFTKNFLNAKKGSLNEMDFKI